MANILLIRPGTTEFDQQGRVQGTLNIPLCEDGRQQVATMVAELRQRPIAAIYSSPSECAVQTAQAVADEFGLKVKKLDTLDNLDHGLWQGMLVSEVKAKQPKVYRQWQEHPETVCPPQGEPLVAAKERAQTTIAKLLKKHKGDGLFAVVAPEPLASVIRNVLNHAEWGDLWHCCANGGGLWQLIEVPEAAEVK